jgi:hypothetical protein
MLGLFDPGYGGDVFLRNVTWLPVYYPALISYLGFFQNHYPGALSEHTGLLFR